MGKPYWIVADWAVQLLRQSGLSSQLIDYFFNNSHTLLIDTKGSASLAKLPNAVPLLRFTSFADLTQGFSTGAVPPSVKAIMYDSEAWSFTPVNEKTQPIAYAAQAASVTHQHGMTFVFTPAVNLADVTASGANGKPTRGSKYQDYLNLNIAGQGARVSDDIEIQAQQAEATPEFVPFVTAAVAQARAANPRALVLLGIGTNPAGRNVTSQELFDAYRSTRSMVDGYWLNVPGGGPQCPACGHAQPQVAVAFLQTLARSLAA